jgi:exonuclease III
VYANFNLKVGSFNIHGQGTKNQIKLRKICNLFTRGNFDVLLLQETRTDGSEKELKNGKKCLIPSKFI